MKRLLPHTFATGLAIAWPRPRPPHRIGCPERSQACRYSITEARVNSSGAFTPPGARSRPLEKLPNFCAVKGILRPMPTSAIQFEVWLPESGWNGKLHVVGNGGLAGTISYPAMADSLRDGFATASTTPDTPRPSRRRGSRIANG